MMRSVLSITVLAALVIAWHCSALASPIEFRSFLSGTSCQQLTAKLQAADAKKELVLIVGAFITGVNYVKRRDSLMELEGMTMILTQYCKNNPDQSLTSALIYLDLTIDRRIEMGP